MRKLKLRAVGYGLILEICLASRNIQRVQNPTTDWAAIRARFPLLEKKTYLNSCSYGALAIEVREALNRYLSDRDEKGTDWNHWVERNESVRGSVAELLGANPDEVAITTSATEPRTLSFR